MPIEDVLQLSRSNQDVEARKAFATIDKRFDDINQQAEVLIKLNRDEAAEVQSMKFKLFSAGSLIFLAVITAVGTVLGLACHGFGNANYQTSRSGNSRSGAASGGEKQGTGCFFRPCSSRSAWSIDDYQSCGPQTFRSRIPGRQRACSSSPRHRAGWTRLFVTCSRCRVSRAVCPEAVADISGIAVSLEEELKTNVDSVNGVLRLQLEPANVRCSDVLLRQAVWNICDNAVKYRRSDVRFELDITGEKVRMISMSCGFPTMAAECQPQDAGRVFEPFFRAERPNLSLEQDLVCRLSNA